MTQATQAPEVDPLESFEKRPSVSFDPTRISDVDGKAGHAMGEWAMLEVDGYLELVDRRDDKKQIMRYEDTGNAMKSVVLAVREGGVDKALWGKKPGGLFTALSVAQNKLREVTGDPKRRIRPGDVLAVRWASLGDQPENKMYSRPKIFEATVKPGELPPHGADPIANTSSNPFETAATAPAPTPAPAVQQQQAAPQMGGDPWANTAPAAPAPSAPAPAAAIADDPFGAPPAGEDAPPY